MFNTGLLWKKWISKQQNFYLLSRNCWLLQLFYRQCILNQILLRAHCYHPPEPVDCSALNKYLWTIYSKHQTHFSKYWSLIFKQYVDRKYKNYLSQDSSHNEVVRLFGAQKIISKSVKFYWRSFTFLWRILALNTIIVIW